MKRVLQFSVLILLYIVFSAKSCDNEEQSTSTRKLKNAQSSQDSISSAFGVEKPTEYMLHAYEETAKQQFGDFLDYSNITSDTASAKEFKVVANKMIRELFLSESDVFYFKINDRNKTGTTSKANLNSNQEVRNAYLRNLKPDSIWVIKNLAPVSDSVYNGCLGYIISGSIPSVSGNSVRRLTGTIDFFAIKRNKKFGDETHKVWTILFGHTELTNSSLNILPALSIR